MPHEENHTGNDAVIKIPSGNEIEVTNVTWDRTVNSTETQHNNSLKPTNVTTGLRFSGSFEYEGVNEELRQQLWYTEGDPFHEAGEPKKVTMTVKELPNEPGQQGLPRTVTFTGVEVDTETRDLPSDDVSSTSFDFTAEDISVSS
jgi:hypothetical protein